MATLNTAVHATAPTRTTDQRTAALAQANHVRVQRARVKRLLHAGVLDVADVISNPLPSLMTMKVLDLLKATPKIGCVKATRHLNCCRISLHKTVGGLSSRQREELVRELTVGSDRS